jgi:tRNA A37 threonylcarbamoyladenosine biosynthesis protein TsaE
VNESRLPRPARLPFRFLPHRPIEEAESTGSVEYLDHLCLVEWPARVWQIYCRNPGLSIFTVVSAESRTIALTIIH